ncbi:MAG: zf-HC2 domain-containing protein [Candidatus Eisenbacteria bacterium]
MRCEEARKELFELVFGEPDDKKEALLQEHLLSCAACREEERRLLGVRDAVREESGGECAARDDLRERIRASLPSNPRRGGISVLRRPIPAYAAAAACVLVALLVRGLPPPGPRPGRRARPGFSSTRRRRRSSWRDLTRPRSDGRISTPREARSIRVPRRSTASSLDSA